MARKRYKPEEIVAKLRQVDPRAVQRVELGLRLVALGDDSARKRRKQ